MEIHSLICARSAAIQEPPRTARASPYVLNTKTSFSKISNVFVGSIWTSKKGALVCISIASTAGIKVLEKLWIPDRLI